MDGTMTEKSNAGAPTKYEPKFCDEVISFGEQGLSKAQMAARFKVHRETLNNWADTHPEFFDAVKKATALAQGFWEDKLHNAALGIDQETAQANPTLMIFQMKNRFPADWREKQTTEHEVNGAKKVVVEWGE
jgi:hypothetical protein